MTTGSESPAPFHRDAGHVPARDNPLVTSQGKPTRAEGPRGALVHPGGVPLRNKCGDVATEEKWLERESRGQGWLLILGG